MLKEGPVFWGGGGGWNSVDGIVNKTKNKELDTTNKVRKNQGSEKSAGPSSQSTFPSGCKTLRGRQKPHLSKGKNKKKTQW